MQNRYSSNQILRAYVQECRGADKAKKAALSKYTASLLNCSEKELQKSAKPYDTYAALKKDIRNYIKNLAPSCITKSLPAIKHLKEYCDAYGNPDSIRRITQQYCCMDGTNVSKEKLIYAILTLKRKYTAPDYLKIQAEWTSHPLVITTRVPVHPITRQVFLHIPAGFANIRILSSDSSENTAKVHALSDIQSKKAAFKETDFWYDDNLLSAVDKQDWYQICVDEDGMIPIETENDLFQLVKHTFSYIHRDNVTIQYQNNKVDTFYVYDAMQHCLGIVNIMTSIPTISRPSQYTLPTSNAYRKEPHRHDDN